MVEVNTFLYYGFQVPEDLAAMTGAGHQTFGEISNQHIALLRKYVGLNAGEYVLEVGCGIGRDAIPLARHFGNNIGYTGIDIIRPSIQWCENHITPLYPNFRFIHLDINDEIHNRDGTLEMEDIDVDIDSDSVDLIFMFSVATHLLPDQLRKYFDIFVRALRPSGRICMSVFLMDHVRKAALQTHKVTAYGLDFRIDFAPGVYIQDPERPHAAVAFELAIVVDALKGSALQLSRDPIWGDWCQGLVGSEVAGQDVLIIKKRQ